jgi:hypothetical protein
VLQQPPHRGSDIGLKSHLDSAQEKERNLAVEVKRRCPFLRVDVVAQFEAKAKQIVQFFRVTC